MRALLRHYDKLLLALGVLVFLAAGAFGAMRLRKLDQIASRNPAAAIEPARYDLERAVIPSIATVVWNEPPAQSRGSEWRYDVFTPPVIYYNEQTRRFTVTPPTKTAPVPDTTADQGFDIELLAVRQEPYRIQLVGSIGEPDNLYATFKVIDTGETLLGRPGKHFPRHEFSLKSFDLRRITTPMGDGMPIVETVAVAVILDERTGREETLTDRETKMMPRLQATFRINVYPGETRTVYEGASLEANGQVYQVMRVSMFPSQAVVSRRSRDALGIAETRTLTVAMPGRETSRGRTSGIVPEPE